VSFGIVHEDRLQRNLNTATSVPPDLASEIVSRYSITPLEESIRICRSALECDGVSLAMLGRFKAGKSSFLNHFIGRDFLPVGVIPITSVVTEMAWALEESAEVRFLDGRVNVRT